MLIVVPAVSKYLDNSKKEAYVKEINSFVDTIRYDLNSGDSNYKLDSNNEGIFYLTDIGLEKGLNKKSPYGDFIKSYSYVKVSKIDNDSYKYEVQAKDKGGKCIALTSIDNLKIESISNNCDSLIPIFGSYTIGQKISYKNSNWYVIENSPKDQNYVVLLKENVLTTEEMNGFVLVFNDGTVDENKLTYYWSSTCHSYDATYGNVTYTDVKTGGCGPDTVIFRASKIKEALDSYMSNKGMTNDLAEVTVDGTNYKIRLITKSELTDNLGCRISGRNGNNCRYTNYSSWIYSSSIGKYWTMTPYPFDNRTNTITVVYDSGDVIGSETRWSYGVRPVINLLKSAIP